MQLDTTPHFESVTVGFCYKASAAWLLLHFEFGWLVKQKQKPHLLLVRPYNYLSKPKRIEWKYYLYCGRFILMFKHEASWGCEFVDSQTRWDVYLLLQPDCFSPVKPCWPIQHTPNPARSCFENVSACTSKLFLQHPHSTCVCVFEWIWTELSLGL